MSVWCIQSLKAVQLQCNCYHIDRVTWKRVLRSQKFATNVGKAVQRFIVGQWRVMESWKVTQLTDCGSVLFWTLWLSIPPKVSSVRTLLGTFSLYFSVKKQKLDLWKWSVMVPKHFIVIVHLCIEKKSSFQAWNTSTEKTSKENKRWIRSYICKTVFYCRKLLKNDFYRDYVTGHWQL